MNNLLVLVHPVNMNVQNMLSVSIVASTKVNLTFQKNCAENTTRKKMVNFIDANAMKITKVMEKFANYQTPVRLVKMIAHKRAMLVFKMIQLFFFRNKFSLLKADETRR